jgi:uncharacterized RDD family membrane protein YckC
VEPYSHNDRNVGRSLRLARESLDEQAHRRILRRRTVSKPTSVNVNRKVDSPVKSQAPPATLDARFWAAVADFVVAAVPTVFLIAKLVPLLPAGLLPEGAIQTTGAVGFAMSPLAGSLVVGVLSFVYLVGCWMLLGATPFQRSQGQRVVDAESGSRIGLWQAVKRWALLVAPLIVFEFAVGAPVAGYAVIVGAIVYYAYLARTVALDGEHRGLHDRVAGTIVLQVIWK